MKMLGKSIELQELLDYANLTIDKSRRDQAIDYYENLHPRGQIENSISCSSY